MLDKLFFPNKKLQIAERQLVSLRDELNRALERIKAAEKNQEKHEDSLEQIAELKKTKTELEQSLQYVETERWRLAREVRSLNGQVSKLRNELDENRKNHSDQIELTRRYKEECESLKNQLKKLENDTNLAAVQSKSQEVEIRELKFSIERANKSIDKYRSDIGDLNVKLTEASRLSSLDSPAMKKKIGDLELMLQGARNCLHAEKLKADSLDRLGRELKSELDKLRDSENNLRLVNKQLKGQINPIVSANKAQNKLNNIVKKLSMTESKYEDLIRENELLAETHLAREAALLELLEREKKINESLRENVAKSEQYLAIKGGKSASKQDKAPVKNEFVANSAKPDSGKLSDAGLSSKSPNAISSEIQSTSNNNESEADAWNKLLGQGTKLKLKPINQKKEDASICATNSAIDSELEFSGPFRVAGATEKSLNNSVESLTKVFELIEKSPRKYLNLDNMLEYLRRNLNTTVRVIDMDVLTLSVSALQRTDFRASGIFKMKTIGALDHVLIKKVEKACSLALLALTMDVPTPWHLYVFRFIKAESVRLSSTKDTPKNTTSA